MEVTILSRKNLLTTIRNIAEPIAEELGYDLVDLEFVKEGKRPFFKDIH